MLCNAFLNVFCLFPVRRASQSWHCHPGGVLSPGTYFDPCFLLYECFLILYPTHEVDHIPPGSPGLLGWQFLKCIVSYQIESPE